MPLVHLVARMREPYRLFDCWAHAAWMWERLQPGFPSAVTATLMPNHLHILLRPHDPQTARARLAKSCGHLQRRTGVIDLFEPVPAADIVPKKKAPRVARYIDLNSCRAGLVSSPLQWPWSSLRDLVGATADRWIDNQSHARALGRWRATHPEQWLDYLLRDDRVTDRRVLPKPVPPSAEEPAFGLGQVLRATCAALRAPPSAVQLRGRARALFLALAADQGFATGSIATLEKMTAARKRAVERGLRRPVPQAWLTAARLCLSDPRLTSALSGDANDVTRAA